jgi:integrase/recombinase XerD
MTTSQKAVRLKEHEQLELLQEYQDFLRNHRGLKEKTIGVRGRYVTEFLKALSPQNDRENIKKISVSQVYDYVIKTAKPMRRPTKKCFVSSIRSFLKFAHLMGYIPRDITEAVPAVETPKLGSIPRGIPWESVENLLAVAGANIGTHTGRRSYAVLQLLTTYGVRIGQVAKLQLRDIKWREGLIHFSPLKSGKPLCLPLYPEVADALLTYIRKTRRGVPYPEVFLTVCGDPAPLSNGGSLYTSMKTCFRHAGITSKSAHSIRHAFATRLMEQATPIKTIADMLGHKSIQNTFIYTKVDVKHLRLLAHEWPEVES